MVKNERPRNPVVGRPDGLISATWISNERLSDDAPLLQALQEARESGGLVVQFVAELMCVRPDTVDLLIPHLWAWTDVYFDEMVALLPRPGAGN